MMPALIGNHKPVLLGRTGKWIKKRTCEWVKSAFLLPCPSEMATFAPEF